MNDSGIRKPTVSGSFYNSDSISLKKQIENCFLHKIGPGKIPVTSTKKAGNIIGLISPHAGYIYSGPVAANGFYEIALNGRPDTIIILGPNHRGFGANVSIMIKGKWETPLGKLEIDTDIAKNILEKSKIMEEDKRAHQYEHSIEVQLPFLQYIYDNNIKIIPISMTRQDIETDIDIAKSISSAVINRNILIIASSDFTHYETQEYAENIDKQAINAIINFDPKKLYSMIYKENLTMCGPGPITVMIISCKALGAKKAKLLKYATSGDITGIYNQVVGYASLIVTR